MTSFKRTWAEINLDALEHNYNVVREITDKNAKLCCVIKADAYGHGAERVSHLFEELGADFFGVSSIDEALQLRNNGIKTPILIMGYTPAKEAKTLAENNISQCIYSLDYAKALSQNAVKDNVDVKIHLKIDTGMNRIGFTFEDINDNSETLNEIMEAAKLPNLYHEGIFTHFAVADDGDNGTNFTMRQYGCFKEMIETLIRNDIMFDIKHCANSGAVLDYPLIHMDMVRAGIILYGLYPSKKVRNKADLQPALELKSVVSHVKTIRAGATVSYGRVFTADKEMKIATIPVGYADGYPRILSKKGESVLISGKRCKIVGRICMDQMMADVSDIEDVKIGDVVTLIGKDGDEFISAEELAGFEESINYEVVCDIGKRVPRVYIKNDKVESVVNQLVPEE